MPNNYAYEAAIKEYMDNGYIIVNQSIDTTTLLSPKFHKKARKLADTTETFYEHFVTNRDLSD